MRKCVFNDHYFGSLIDYSTLHYTFPEAEELNEIFCSALCTVSHSMVRSRLSFVHYSQALAAVVRPIRSYHVDCRESYKLWWMGISRHALDLLRVKLCNTYSLWVRNWNDSMTTLDNVSEQENLSCRTLDIFSHLQQRAKCSTTVASSFVSIQSIFGHKKFRDSLKVSLISHRRSDKHSQKTHIIDWEVKKSWKWDGGDEHIFTGRAIQWQNSIHSWTSDIIIRLMMLPCLFDLWA